MRGRCSHEKGRCDAHAHAVLGRLLCDATNAAIDPGNRRARHSTHNSRRRSGCQAAHGVREVVDAAHGVGDEGESESGNDEKLVRVISGVEFVIVDSTERRD